MADTELNISPDEKVAGVPLARLLRNLDETSYNEGSVDLACRLTDCKAVIEELLQQRALASRPAEVDEAWVLLFEALPHVSPQAVNWAMARVGPIEDAYIGTRIRKYLERVASPSHAINKDGA